MKELILRVLNEFKWNDSTDEPDLPETPKEPKGKLIRVRTKVYHYITPGGVWHIKPSGGHPDGNWSYTHEDYDGTPIDRGGPPADPRHGAAKTPHDCAHQIDELFPETHEEV